MLTIYLILSTLLAIFMFSFWNRKSKLDVCIKFYILLLSFYGVIMILQNLGFVVQTAGG